jgi:alpha-tubulin suppressor-like RCC1 family protein
MNATSIGVSNIYSCAAKSDNSVWCWGTNNNGQLGNGTTTDSYTPVQVLGL